MSHDKTIKLMFASLILGTGLSVPVAFADDWDQARDRLRRAEEELGKDTRQYNEARANRDRKGMENEAREIQKDRQDIARRRSELDGMRRSYDVDYGWNRNRDWDRDHDERDRDHDHPGKGWGWGHHKKDRDDWWRENRRDDQRHDAWRELRNDQNELRQDHQEMQDAWRRGDRRGVENERREIYQDRREIEQDRDRIQDLHQR